MNVETMYNGWPQAVDSVEDSEEATLCCSFRAHLLCYMKCGCGRNTSVWERVGQCWDCYIVSKGQ